MTIFTNYGSTKEERKDVLVKINKVNGLLEVGDVDLK